VLLAVFLVSFKLVCVYVCTDSAEHITKLWF